MLISYSALETYKNCPRKYQYQYIEKIKRPKGREAILGSAVHSALEFMHQNAVPFPAKEEVIDFFSRGWNSHNFESEKEEGLMFQEGLKMLARYCDQNNPVDFQVVDLESFFKVEIGEDGEGESHALSGIIDRIDKLKDGSFEIIDYKTARRLPSQKEIDENLQLSIYWMALRDRWPKKDHAKNKVSLYYLKHGEKLSSRRNDSQIDKVKKEILERIQEIKTSSFEPEVNPLCPYCEYRNICPVTKHRYQKDSLKKEEISKLVDRYLELKDKEKILKKEIGKLGGEINLVLDKEGLKQVFSTEGKTALLRSARKTYGYDNKKIREILEPLGKWDEVIKVDNLALGKLLDKMPFKVRKEIEGLREVKSETHGLVVKKQDKRN